MEALNILIVEDDAEIAASLSDMLEMLNYNVAGIAESYDASVDLLNTKTVDLALLDIQLKGDKTGIDVAEALKNSYKLPFVFTTAFADKETIQKASMHSPYGYLVKPYGMKDIHASIEVAIINHNSLSSEIEGKEQAIFNAESLFVKYNNKIIRIPPKDILYIEAKGDYTLFKTDSKGYIVSSSMKSAESKLDPSIFVKVHRSYIININRIVDIEENNLVIADQVIPISRSQKPKLIERLNLI